MSTSVDIKPADFGGSNPLDVTGAQFWLRLERNRLAPGGGRVQQLQILKSMDVKPLNNVGLR